MASILGYSAAPEPAYSVIQKFAEYEIRHYGPQLRAQVVMPGQMDNTKGNAFRALAGYIFGGNRKQGHESEAEKIAMTAPVAMNTTQSEKIQMTAPVAIQQPEGQPQQRETIMSFILPDKYTSTAELPVPKDSRVTLLGLPQRDMAVIGFSWGLTEQRFREHEQRLRLAAARDKVQLSTDPKDVELWGYNPPWTLPWCKRNEVAIPVVKQ
ncbi:SOUL hem-binding protein [Dunaliella salina]|uniref:SOUL hem-binding protein n=1 Tax=Dunaliella salina TaxID=3046 RepID=A0ABQ7GBC2_DUNSA|nr:SOUL hem-binding protein [Dunaliella salina]|eukprot:KAF5831915.1 SOUL hem-binding protein [Dunaliella salina]